MEKVKIPSCMAAVLLAQFISGCVSSRVSTVRSNVPLDHPVKSIALAPSGGFLADAIGIELFNNEFTVVDTNQTSSMLIRMNLDELQILTPQTLSKFKEKGIDAVMSVKSVAGPDGLPQSVAVRLSSTNEGKIIAGVTWQNGWGGMPGSMADRTMRKDTAMAAKEIVKALIKNLRGETTDMNEKDKLKQ